MSLAKRASSLIGTKHIDSLMCQIGFTGCLKMPLNEMFDPKNATIGSCGYQNIAIILTHDALVRIFYMRVLNGLRQLSIERAIIDQCKGS